MHPKSLNRHLKKTHNTEFTPSCICVDESEGIYFVKKSMKGGIVYCNSSLFNQFWKTEAAETGVYSRILRVFQNSLPPDVINTCILMQYQWWGVLEYGYLK